jgi:hypothetical protein
MIQWIHVLDSMDTQNVYPLNHIKVISFVVTYFIKTKIITIIFIMITIVHMGNKRGKGREEERQGKRENEREREKCKWIGN